MNIKPKNNSTMKNKLHLIGFIVGVFLVCVILFITYKLPCPSSSQYVTFKTILAVAIAALISVLPGFFTIRYGFGHYVISAGGAIGIFWAVFTYTPKIIDTNDKCQNEFEYTFSIEDSSGNTPIRDKGLLSIRSGIYTEEASIEKDGSATFRNIPASLRDSSVALLLNVPGWTFMNDQNQQKIYLKERNQRIKIKRRNSIYNIKGRVMKNDGTILSHVLINLDDDSARTDNNGMFSISLSSQNRALNNHLLTATYLGRVFYSQNVILGSTDLVQILYPGD
jgi:hypothetical protein